MVMGGWGSGRQPSFPDKDTVEDCRVIDVNQWMRKGVLVSNSLRCGRWVWSRPGTGEELASMGYAIDTIGPAPPTIRLSYTLTATGEHCDYPVRLQTTQPRFGGIRWWFTCPLVTEGPPCQRRVQKLYLPPGGRYYGCRHCYQLRYASQQDSTVSAFAQAQAIRVRLGGDPRMHTPFPPKPKGMWWRTYYRLRHRFRRISRRVENRWW